MRFQGANERLIDAEPARIWDVLVDPARIPEYMRAVTRMESAPEREAVGAARTCQVSMQGKQGRVVERCTELEENRRLTHVLDDDDFGFSKLFDGFGFAFLLEPRAGGRTLVRIEGFYRERGLASRVLNRLVMRRKLSRLRDGILAELATVVDQR